MQYTKHNGLLKKQLRDILNKKLVHRPPPMPPIIFSISAMLGIPPAPPAPNPPRPPNPPNPPSPHIPPPICCIIPIVKDELLDLSRIVNYK